MTILSAIFGLLVVGASFGFIVFIHEMGHFLAARAVGIRCPQFAIGVGPAILSFKRRGTVFAWRLFPIGGYVLMVGEDPNADPQDSWHHTVGSVLTDVSYPVSARSILSDWDTVTARSGASQTQIAEVREHLESCPADVPYQSQLELEGNFNHKTIVQRMVVILGGVVMNFLAAIFLMWCLGFTVGRGELRRDTQAMVASVQEGGPAQRAGVEVGDVVVAIDGQPIVSGMAMIRAIAARPSKPTAIRVLRKGQNIDLNVTPEVQINGLFFEQGPGGLPRVNRVLADLRADLVDDAAVGDVVDSVNGEKVENMAGFIDSLRKVSKGKKPDEECLWELGRSGKKPLSLKLQVQRANLSGKTGIVPASVTTLSFVKTAGREVEAVTPGSPAAAAGFLPGDILLSVDGYDVYSDLSTERVLKELAAPTVRDVEIDIYRDKSDKPLVVPGPVPASLNELGLQLKPINVEDILITPFQHIWKAICTPYEIIHGLTAGHLKVKTVKKEVSGPIGMMRMIYQVSENGVASWAFFLAVLNALIGGFNLFPFPALDGARFLVLAIAGIRGKEIDPSREMVFHFAGIMVLLSLVGIISIQDIQTWWAGTPLVK